MWLDAGDHVRWPHRGGQLLVAATSVAVHAGPGGTDEGGSGRAAAAAAACVKGTERSAGDRAVKRPFSLPCLFSCCGMI